MIEFDNRKIGSEYEEGHIARVAEYLEHAVSRQLIGKAEAGTGRSERGYQLISASTCGSIARAIGGNENKAKVLSMAVGLYFPKYGHEGLKAVKQYIIDHNIDLDLESLGLTAVCYFISQYCHQTSKPRTVNVFYDLVYDYFYGIDQYEESKIVRLVQNTIMEIKRAEHFYDGNPGDLLFNVTQELIQLAREHKALKKGTLLEKYQHKIKDYHLPGLTEEERQDIYNGLDEYMESFTNHKGELAKFDKTKEETVLTYIYLEQ